MASGTINGSTGNQYIDSKIVWSSTPTTSTNTSKVTAALYYKRNNTGYTTYGEGTFTISIGGNKTSVTKSLTITEDAWVKAVEATETITHDSDGTKSVKIAASGSIPSTSLTSTSCSKTVDLDTIPRASSITSASNRTLGKACAVKWTPLSKSFRYKLKFTLGDWSYTTGAIHPNTTSAYTYTEYTLPLTVANQLPKAKTGTMTVALYTYSNSGATTQVGSASSKTFTITVPENSSTKPTVEMELEPVSSLGEPFSSLYIKGLTKVKATTLTAEAKYSATISSYSMSVLGKSYSSPYQSGYLSTSGNVTVTGKATDSRGYSNEFEQDITVISYGKPKILPASDESEIICARCDVDGNLSESGTYLKIKARRSYYKVTANDVQNNFCAIRYRYRKESTNTFSSWVTILAGSNTSTNTIDSDPISGVVSSTTTAYVVQVGVIDDIGYSDAVQFNIPTDFVTVDIPEKHYGKRIGIFRYASDAHDDEENHVDIDGFVHGGGVDNLTIGTRLTASSTAPLDLNDYRTPNNYYSPSAENSQYITNSPYTEGGFGLEVREMQSKNLIRQTLYYGRTTWTRHWNGSTEEWSGWLRYLMTSQDTSYAVDFVTEIGLFETDTGSWRYKKWKSGTYDMSGVFDVQPTVSNVFSNGVAYYSDQIQIELPFSVETIQYTGSPAEQYYWLMNAALVDENTIGFRLARFLAINTTSPVVVRLIARGRWK